MPGPEETGGTHGPAGRGDLTPAAVEAVLADFRAWLTDLASGVPGERPASAGCSVREQPADAGRSPGTVDLFTLVGQFTALRHEVNMQTRAARNAVEQNAEVLRQLTAATAEPEPEPEPDDEPEPAAPDELRPLVKAFIDIADALTLSLRQMEKLRDSAEPLLEDLESGGRDADARGANAPRSPSPGFFARLFGAKPAPVAEVVPNDRAKPAADKLRQLVAAAADGYALSLRRVERVLPTLDLESLACVGEPFDPELMEVVEVVGDSGRPAGTVVEEVRPGYLWRGGLFRYAQVKVAR